MKVARNLSLAIGRHSPSFGSRDLFADGRTATLAVDRPSFTLRKLVALVRETFSVIAAAGRVGAAVEARQAPAVADLKTAGLAEAEIFKAPYRF